MLSESAPLSPVSTGNTCRKKAHRRFMEEFFTSQPVNKAGPATTCFCVDHFDVNLLLMGCF